MQNKIKMIGTCAAAIIIGAITSLSPGTLKTSESGLMLILDYESCRLQPYQCSAGKWTDGIGNTNDVDPNRKITEQEAVADLIENIRGFEKQIDRLVVTPVTQPTYDALVSFTYNVGVGNLKKSTLLKKLNSGDVAGACNEMTRWVYSSGKKLKGLERRRANERDLCLSGVSL